jgi:hypothetical protein
MNIVRGDSLGRLLGLIGDRTVVHVCVTKGLGCIIQENVDITDPNGIDCIQTGKNSLLFLTSWDEASEESYSVVLKIPKNAKFSGKSMSAEAITEADFTITGIFDTTTFTILCK